MAVTQLTTTGTLAPTMQTYYDRNMLERLVADDVHTRWAKKKPLPARAGKTIQFRRMGSLANVTTPLTEGTPPAGSAITVTAITADVKQYGDFTQVSDLLDLTALDPLIDEQTAVHADQARLSIDALVRDVLNAGTNVQYAAGRVSRVTVAAGDLLTVAELRKARRTLKRNNVKPAEGNDYIAIVEPGAAYDLMSDVKWEDVQKYVDPKNMIQGEVGRIYGVRVVEANTAAKFAGAGAASVDVYSTLVFGREAYGMTEISGSGAPKTYVKPLGSAGTADPLDQISTIGWKCLFGTVILQQAAILRIEHTVSG